MRVLSPGEFDHDAVLLASGDVPIQGRDALPPCAIRRPSPTSRRLPLCDVPHARVRRPKGASARRWTVCAADASRRCDASVKARPAHDGRAWRHPAECIRDGVRRRPSVSASA